MVLIGDGDWREIERVFGEGQRRADSRLGAAEKSGA